MASFWYNNALKLIADGTIKASDTLKVMLVKSTYTPANHNDTVVSTNLTGNEIVATNYTGAYGGSGRKTATITNSADNTIGTAGGDKWVFSNITWTALGGATNDTIGAAALIKEVTNDAGSTPILYWDLTDTPTNGSDFTLTMDASAGNAQITT